MKMNTELTINVRPVRHAYFIVEDDLAQFIEVASFCCTQWGGINNLIIPVQLVKEADHIDVTIDGWHLDMLNRRHPDIFVNALSSQEDCSLHHILQNYLASRSFTQSLVEWNVFIDIDDTVHPLHIISPQSGSEKPELAMPASLPGFSPPLTSFEKAILVAAFGEIWHDQEKEYKEAYTLQAWDASNPEFMLRQQLYIHPTESVINLTLTELSNIGTEEVVPEAPYMSIVIAQTVWDLCTFWNLRACAFGFNWLSDRRVLLLSKEQLLQEQKAYVDPLSHLLKEKRIHPGVRTNLDAIFYHRQDKEISQFLSSHEEFRQQTESLELNIHFPPRSIEEDEKETLNDNKAHRPILYVENKIIDRSSYQEYGGSRPTISIPFPEGNTTLFVPHSGPHTRSYSKAYIGFQGEIWDQFPAHPAVAQLIAPEASFDVFLNTIQLRYPYMLPLGQLTRISLTLPHAEDMYRAYFGAAGYDTSPSEKEAYAKGLLGMAGGLSNDKASIFRSRIAYEILDVLTERPTKKLAQEIIRTVGSEKGIKEEALLQAIRASDVIPSFRRVPRFFKDIYSAVKEKLNLGPDGKKECLRTLAQLVGIKAVQRGMHIKCARCGAKVWYGLHMLDERIRCNGCLEMFDLPLVENENDNGDRPFQYTLNPLVNQAMDQDILPVIISLLTLKTRQREMYHVAPGMNFQLQGQANTGGDFDFTYIYKHQIYGGECKAGSRFTEKDIRTARIAQTLGFRAFFFVTVQSFDDEAKLLIQNYQQELMNLENTDTAFEVFVLDAPILFDMQPLPAQIPS